MARALASHVADPDSAPGATTYVIPEYCQVLWLQTPLPSAPCNHPTLESSGMTVLTLARKLNYASIQFQLLS